MTVSSLLHLRNFTTVNSINKGSFIKSVAVLENVQQRRCQEILVESFFTFYCQEEKYTF